MKKGLSHDSSFSNNSSLLLDQMMPSKEDTSDFSTEIDNVQFKYLLEYLVSIFDCD